MGIFTIKPETQNNAWQDPTFGAGAAFVEGTENGYFFHGQAGSHPLPQIDQVCLFTPDFYLEDPMPWFTFAEVRRDWPRGFDPSVHSELDLQKLTFRSPDKTQYAADFDKVKSAIDDRAIDKAVPILRASGDIDFATFCALVPTLLANLRQNQGARQLCYLNLGYEGLLGLSPERFLDWEFAEGQVRLLALAGTRPKDRASELFADPKERREHDLVIEGIVGAFRGEGHLSVGPTQVSLAGSLAHLSTEIVCELNDPTPDPDRLMTWVGRLHPTPALGVKSRRADLNFRWLKELRAGGDRRRYGAPFGVWDPQYGVRLCVAIRNLQWVNGEVFLITGSGVIA